MSQLLFLKTLGEEYLIKSVKCIEKYLDTHANVNLSIEVYDNGVYVYDRAVLLLNIKVSI